MRTLSNDHIKFGTMVALAAALIGIGAPLGNKIIIAYVGIDSVWLQTPLHGFLLPTLALLIVGAIILASKTSSRDIRISTGRIWLLATIAAIASINIAVFGFYELTIQR